MPTAADQVFNIRELLEMIILEMDLLDIVTASRVSKLWLASIANSRKIQRTLFLVPTPTTARWQQDLTIPGDAYAFLALDQLTDAEKAYLHHTNTQAFAAKPRNRERYEWSDFEEANRIVIPAAMNPLMYQAWRDLDRGGETQLAFPVPFRNMPYRGGSWEQMRFCSELLEEDIWVEGLHFRCGEGDCDVTNYDSEYCEQCEFQGGRELHRHFAGDVKLGDIVAPVEWGNTSSMDIDWFYSRIALHGIEALDEGKEGDEQLAAVKKNTAALKAKFARTQGVGNPSVGVAVPSA